MRRDPGLQPERTALAWRRTAMAMLVNGVLLVRTASAAHSPALLLVAIVTLLAAVVLFAVGGYRQKALARAPAPRSPHAAVPALLLATVWLTCAAALASLLS